MATMGALNSSQVRHGRRTGQTRGAPVKMESLTDDQIPCGTLLPSGVDLRQVTILPDDEWKRIQDSLDKLTRKAAKLRAEKKAKKDMHVHSQEMVKHWTNTYAGMREKKLKAKQLRAQDEENERQRIDMEEEIYKAQERKKAIESAKIYQYHQTDRVKTFHSALLLSKVLKERDAQIAFQKSRLKTDAKWEEQLKQNIEKAFREEKEKEDKRHNDRVALSKDHLKQIKEKQEVEEQRKREEEEDAKEIKEQARLHEIDLENKRQKSEEKMLECKRIHLETMENRNIVRALEEQEREEEDEKIRKFIKAKKGLTKIRKEKDAETYKLMEERKERIFNFLYELNRKKLDNEDVIIARDIAEAEAEIEASEKEQKEKRKAKLKEIEEYRLAVIKSREEQEKKEKEEAEEERLALVNADKMFWDNEKEKRRKANEERQTVQTYNIQQIAEKKVNLKQEMEMNKEYSRETEALALEKEREFKQYAREVIESEAQTTKHIYPMLRALRLGPGGGRGPSFLERGGIRPSYQAMDFYGTQLPDYASNKSVQVGDDIEKTKGRLGFTW